MTPIKYNRCHRNGNVFSSNSIFNLFFPINFLFTDFSFQIQHRKKIETFFRLNRAEFASEKRTKPDLSDTIMGTLNNEIIKTDDFIALPKHLKARRYLRNRNARAFAQ